MKSPSAWLVVLVLLFCCLANGGCCHKDSTRSTIDRLASLNPKTSFQKTGIQATSLMADSSCSDIFLQVTEPSYLTYMHNGETVHVIYGPRCGYREFGEITRMCNGDILLHRGFAYVHIATPRSASAGSGTTTAPSVPAPMAPRPWLKTVRVRTTGEGSTWAIEVDGPDSQTVVDRIFFVDGTSVPTYSEFYGTVPGDGLDSGTAKTFLTCTDGTLFSSEATITSDPDASDFAACITPYACFWGLPAPNPCPPPE